MRFYCDVHRRRDDSGYRITYTTDGETFKHVDSPTDILVEAGDQVYVDTMPIIHTDAFIELLKRGAEVYYLRRLTSVEKIRQRLGIESKSARTDIKILMSIDEKWFRRVDEDFLVMREMFSAFMSLERTKQRLDNQLKAASEATRENLRNVLQATEMEKTRLARKIAEEAEKRYPTFKTLAEELGITGDNHVLTRRALAELMTYVDFNRSFTKVRNYVGLFRCRIRNKKYNHKARQALTRLTMALIGRTPIARGEEEVLFRIWLTFRREALERLAGIPVQQQG